MIFTFLFLVFANAQIGLESFLNANQRAGLTDFQKFFGSGISSADSGMMAYASDVLARNPCVLSRAQSMYDEVQKINNTRLGEGLYASLPPSRNGFLWELAMKHSGGDPNLAFELIAICGQDDGMSHMGRDGINCPRAESDFYTPGALGADANIPPTLRDRIARSQGDGDDTSFIRPKYYHVMASASAACLMLRRGVPAFVARTAALTVPNAYRSARLCSSFSYRDPQHISKIESILNGSVPMPVAPEDTSGLFPIGSFEYTYLHLFHYPVNIVREKLQRELSYLYAQQIVMANSTIARECSSSNNISMELTSYLRNNNHRKGNVCPTNITTQRCQEALNRIDTWAVDREWTESQHIAGFEFARTHCKPTYNDDRALERSACSVQQEGGSLTTPAGVEQ